MTHSFNSERIPSKSVVGTLVVGAFLALTVGAEKIATDSDRRRYNKKARLIDHDHDGEKVIYIMPGCRADGEYIGEMLDPHIQHIGPNRSEAYSDDDFDLEDIKKKELEARARDLGKTAVVYCSSMGGMKFIQSLADKEYREGFGEIETLIFDSSPAAKKNLDSGTRFAMFLSEVLPPSWTLSRLYRGFMRRKARDLNVHHSPKVTKEQVHGHKLSSADTPLLAVKHQAEFIKQTDLSLIPDGALAGAAKNIYYVSSKHDNVVDTDASYVEINRIFGGSVLRLIDEARDEFGHADGPEHPELLVQLMEGRPPLNDDPTVVPLFKPENEPFPAFSRPLAA